MSARSSRGFLVRMARRLGLEPRDERGAGDLEVAGHAGEVAFGRSPSLREIETLAHASGFRALLNLNTEGEVGQRLSPNVEASWAHAFAMQHERVSIDAALLCPEWVDRFLATLARIARPVYVHSLGGQRAKALMAIHLALERGLSGNQALDAARVRGLDGAADALAGFVVNEVDRRRRTAVAAARSGA